LRYFETISIFAQENETMQFFETIFLEEVDEFMQSLDRKSQQKVMYNVRIAEWVY